MSIGLVANKEFRVLHRFSNAQLRHRTDGVFVCKAKQSGEFSKGVKILTDKLEVVARLMCDGKYWGRLINGYSDGERREIEFVLSDEDFHKNFEMSLMKEGSIFLTVPFSLMVAGVALFCGNTFRRKSQAAKLKCAIYLAGCQIVTPTF